MAELARHRNGSLLFEDVPNLFGTERPQEPGHPALVAAALELNRCTPEQAQVMLGKASLQQFLDWTGKQICGAQLLNAPLGVPPGLLQLGLISVSSSRHLLYQEAGTPLLATGHPVMFGNYNFYYPMLGARQGGGGSTSFSAFNRR